MTAHELTSQLEYKKAFAEWSRLHKYRHDAGELGKRYNDAWETLCAIESGN